MVRKMLLILLASASVAWVNASPLKLDSGDCTYNGVTYTNGSSTTINGQSCDCKNGSWDCH